MSEQKKKKPMTASDYIKNQPHLQGKPLTIQNSFTALAEYPPLSYSKAVTTPSSSTQPKTKPTNTDTQKSTYFVKPQKQHLFTTHFTQPVLLAELQRYTRSFFYDDALYPTDNIVKNQTFYEYILVDSGSVEITHYPDKTNPNLISYSTCKILKIHSIKDLGFLNHHTLKPFSTPGYHVPGYSYTDYRDAFFRTFYLRSYDHSWFLSFDTRCTQTIPGWFNEWWYWFGPTNDIYPPEVLKSSLPYYIKHAKCSPVGPIGKISFHIDMGIPWICSWNFNLILALQDMPYSLVREFRIKWWDKYDLNRCSLQHIQRILQIHHDVHTAVTSISKSIPLLTPSQLKQIDRQTHQSTHPPKPNSPTTSHSSSSSKRSRKKDKLKQLLTQLSQDLDSSSDDEDMVDSDPYGGPLAQGPLHEE